MQVFALKNSDLVHVNDAIPATDYTCPACGVPIYIRSRGLSQSYFCHLEFSYCPLASKSPEHFATQLALESLIGKDQINLEMQFPLIGRIADVAWVEKGLIFEVQRSPITLKEVKAREHDYMSSGFTLVWILHEFSFNKRRISAAEEYIRMGPSAYTNIDARGKGFFYDQQERGRKRWQISRGQRSYIQLQLPEWDGSSLYFSGDRKHISMQNRYELLQKGLLKPTLLDRLVKLAHDYDARLY